MSTLWRVDATVDMTGRSSVAERILESWAHEPGSVRFFRSSANFLYVFRHEGKRYFLRFADRSERSKEAIEAEVDIIEWLARAGVNVATPVRTRAGKLVETVETELGVFYAVVFSELHGSQFEIEELDTIRFREWGAALGKLHAVMKDYSGPGLSARRTWKDDLELARETIPEDAPAIRREWEEIRTALSALPVDREHYGLIHFDFELDNLVWHDHTVGVLDFDDCSHSWYAADIAFALRDLFDPSADLTHPSFREFVRGYCAHNLLDEKIIREIPMFLRMANLLLYARIARALDLPYGQTYPDWLVVLRRKLQDRKEAYTIFLENRGL